MPKASPIQYGFNGGQLGPRLQGRSDLARYSMGCNVLRNFLPTYQGPALKRSGFRHVKAVKDSSRKTRLIPFEFSRDDAYMLELGQGYLRVYKDSGAVVESTVAITNVTAANPVVVTATNSYSAGDQVFVTGTAQAQLNGRYFTVASPTGSNFQLSGENGTGRSAGSGGTAARVFEIEDGVSSNSLPWLEAELDAIQYVQTADVIYLVHGNHPPHKISRTSDTAWTCTEVAFDWPAFREENVDDAVTVVASANSGSGITITGVGTDFDSDLIGSYIAIREPAGSYTLQWQAAKNLQDIDIRIPSSGAAAGDTVYYGTNVYQVVSISTTTGYDPPVHDLPSDNPQRDKFVSWDFYNKFTGYGEITAVGGATSCTVTTEVGFPYAASTSNNSVTNHGSAFAGKATSRFSLGAWNEKYGYPTSIAFYEDRLWFGGTKTDPQTFWGSKTGDYENFETIADEDDSSVVFTLASEKINAIEYMSGQDVLLIGTRGGEFTVDAGSAEQAITPANIRVRRRSNYGAAEGVQPVFVDSTLLFVQRDKRRLHELSYAAVSDRYVAPDLTQMSYDILSSGATELAYQASPLRLLWVALGDGTLASLTYIKDEEVLGWAAHTVGGTNAAVESIAVIPHPDGDQDQLWAIVKRTVNGSTVRYVEYLEKPYDAAMSIPDAFFVDSGLTYSGSATTTLYGLNHLEGETVSVLGDGLVMPDATVSGGSITLGTAVSKAQIGLAIPEARLQTMRLESGAATGTAMGRKKRVYQLVARLADTGEGLRYGGDFTTMDEYPLRDTDDDMDTPVSLFNGDTQSLTMPSDWEQEGRVAVAHDVPLPCTVVSLMPQLVTEER